MKLIEDIMTLKMEQKHHLGKKIGFVPTMGYLHEGHLSLVEAAKKENDLVVMSIFVNPLQFGPNEDFDRYPRDEKRDLQLAEEAGVDILFMPPVHVMYPNEMSVQMKVSTGTDVLCGRSRPGHFDGVVTVLTKLFHLVQATNAYFGLKDAQQFAIVHQFTKDLNFPITIVGVPTIREHDGLAKSSRNVYLSKSERKDALGLYESLQHAKDLVVQGELDPSAIQASVFHYLKEHTKGTIDYVDVLSFPSLKKMDHIEEEFIVAVAVQFNQARLIDNIILNKNGKQIMTINGGS